MCTFLAIASLRVENTVLRPEINKRLTCDEDQGCKAGEGGDVQLHAMEALRKLQDGVDPLPKAPDTLRFMQHGAIAEDELLHFGIGSS